MAGPSAIDTRPVLLDLFCGAGGAAMGYHRAGFRVVGVDIVPQPHYPFEFHQGDALDINNWHCVPDLVHASPPCQRWTLGARRAGTSHLHPALIRPTRDLLESLYLSYVIENVEQAADELRSPVMLCGTMFGLGVFRHRLFESTLPLTAPEHPTHERRVGDGYETVTGHAGGSSSRDGWKSGGVNSWRGAMGVGWMTGDELAESIPPAYTEFIGRQLIQQVGAHV